MRIIALLLAGLCSLAAAPAHADNFSGGWTVVVRTKMVVHREEPIPQGIAQYGPFRVIDGQRAVMAGVTDATTPRHFATMLRDFPGLATLEMRDCPGTEDDMANLRVGRMIRAAGMETYVPYNGSVRSGAVELFLAGASRRIDDGAEFAVHAWEDSAGLQATDYSPQAPENAKYLRYYRDMGMDAQQAASFYAMTNAVPFEHPRWLDAREMRQWVAAPAPAINQPAPQLAYLDLAPALP